MNVEIDEGLDFESFAGTLSWAQTNGLWEGHSVSLENVEQFQLEVARKVCDLLASKQGEDFERLSAFFALLGSSGYSHSLVLRDIQELRFGNQDLIRQVGFGKSVEKFWKKHKKKIITGIIVTVVVVTVVAVTVSSGGSAAGVGAEAGMAAIGALQSMNDDDTSSKSAIHQEVKPDCNPVDQSDAEKIKPNIGAAAREAIETALSGDYEPLGEGELFPTRSWYAEHIPLQQNIHPDNVRPDMDFQNPNEVSGINGIMTSEEAAFSHAAYLQKLAGNYKVDWTFDQSNGLVSDLAGVFCRDYLGVSSQASKTLEEKWTAFHESNLDNPNAKILHFCHSRGAIKTKNSLMSCPKEVSDRIVVVAIAPATVIPSHLCCEAYNYASKKDVVHIGELFWPGFLDSSEVGTSKYMEMVLEDRKNLILLEPHPDATGIDHDFQSPTFAEVIKERIDVFKQKYGDVTFEEE